MPVRLRLQRFGRTHRPFYRIVSADSRAPRDGKHLEVVGTYDPLPNKEGLKPVRLNEERVKYWLGVGAQPTDRVAALLGRAGLTPMPPQRMSHIKMVPKAERRTMSTWAVARAVSLV